MVFAGFSARSQTPEEIAKGINLIETQTYSAEENAELLKLYEGLRVADVSDRMDMVGLPNTGLVSTDIHPDWENTQDMSHISWQCS